MSEENQEPLQGEIISKGIPQTEAEIIVASRDIGLKAQKVTRAQGMDAMSAALTECSALGKSLDKRRKELKEPFITQGKNVDTVFGYALDPLRQGITHLKAEYSLKQQEDRERIRKEAEAEAARIQKNAEKRAETQRKQEEAAKKAAEEAAAAAAAEGASEEEIKAAKAEQERAAQEAIDKAEAAEAIRREAEAEAEHAKAAIATQEAEKAKGVSGRKNWKGEVTDMHAFMKAYMDGDKRLRIEMFQPNKAAINKMVKSQEDGASDIKGLKVYYEDSVTVRT